MRIKLLTVYAGPQGVHYAGDVVEFADMIAADLVKSGYAVAIDAARKAEVIETAIIEPEETEIIKKRGRPSK